MVDVSPRQSGTALLAHGLLLGGAGAAIFLAGGAPQGNLGVFLLCAGVALVLCPPRVRVEWRLWAAAGGLIFCAALSFLPARWWAVPQWRQAVAAAPAVALPGSITAAPGETAFWLALLALSLVVGLFSLSQPVRAKGMIGLIFGAVAGCAVYAALAMFARVSGWHYPFAGEATFGFLPNRNHTATLLITGSVLAMGLMNVAFRDRRWIVADVAVAGGLVCVVALCFFSASRAGVLLLVAGGLLWLGGLRGGHRPGRLLAVAAMVIVIAGGLFFSFKSPARDRALESLKIGQGQKVSVVALSTPGSVGAVAAPADPPSEFRLSIYRDTLAMIRDQPWTGSGLGTFAGVFPQYRRASLMGSNALHPESDWLLLVAEAGVGAFLCVVALVAMAARRLAGLGEHPYWPLRWGCAAAVVAALLHSAVDVPAHRAAVGWWLLALAGLALQRQGGVVGVGGRSLNAENAEKRRKGRREEKGGGQRVVFVVAGLGALVLGGMLVCAEWFGGKALPPFAAESAAQRMFEAYQRKDYAAGMALGQQVMRDSPLTASVYYYQGVLLTAASDEEMADQQTDELFQAERVLDPVMPDVPRHQAGAWAGYDPARETAMILAELGRVGRINRALGEGLKEDLHCYRDLVLRAVSEPDLQRSLLEVTRPDPRFGAVWAQAAPTLAASLEESLAADRAAVGAGGPAQPDWYLQPESAGPVRPGGGSTPNAEWENAGWAVRLRQRVYAGQYQQAVQALAERYGISLAVLSGEAGAGEDGGPDASEAWRELAVVAAREGRWKDAWLALERYVRHTRQMEWP